MKILFEDQIYSPELLENYGLDPYIYKNRVGNEAKLPYVGYIYSSKINEPIFILPKVFLFEGSGNANNGEIAFGKFLIQDVIEINKGHNPLKEDGLDRVLFGLSTWVYRAIDKYSQNHSRSEIIKRSIIQRVNSNKGENEQTLLDTILSLIEFHKKHTTLFTYITIVNSSGYNKIHWGKTITKIQPIIKYNEAFYAEFRNKSKSINYDEELIVLFYSVLEYLRHTYFFPIKSNLNYDLLKPSKIEAMIESGRGTKLLRSIRRKYFVDELVLLWKLLYAFFDKAEIIRSGKFCQEALLASSFNIVFEEMVDNLIGEDIFRDLKENKDGKVIDHIYKAKSLIDNSLIYFIGDSKYYFYGTDLEAKSLYKQFTYAKNIIQLNIKIFNTPIGNRSRKESEIICGVRYRDPLTEGYNITPNFFIRGFVKAEDLVEGHAVYYKDHLTINEQEMPINKHFENRLFDRDTLILQSYNINFLFVLASYINNTGNKSVKERIHERIRTDLLKVFNDRYDFFHVTPIVNMKTFVDKNFEEYIGKMYYSDGAPYIWFAFDKGTITLSSIRNRFATEATIEQAKLE